MVKTDSHFNIFCSLKHVSYILLFRIIAKNHIKFDRFMSLSKSVPSFVCKPLDLSVLVLKLVKLLCNIVPDFSVT